MPGVGVCAVAWTIFMFWGTTKPAMPQKQGLMWKTFCFQTAMLSEYQKDGFVSGRFSASSTAFQIKNYGQKEKICPDVCSVECQKPSESKVVFEQRKGTLHLNGSAHSQIDPAFTGNVCLRHRAFHPEGLVYNQFLRLSRLLCFAASCSLGDSSGNLHSGTML